MRPAMAVQVVRVPRPEASAASRPRRYPDKLFAGRTNSGRLTCNLDSVSWVMVLKPKDVGGRKCAADLSGRPIGRTTVETQSAFRRRRLNVDDSWPRS